MIVQGEPLARCWWVLRPGGDSWSGRRRVSHSGVSHGNHAGKCWRHVAAGQGAGSGTGTSALIVYGPQSLPLQSLTDETTGLGGGIGGIPLAESVQDGSQFEWDTDRPATSMSIRRARLALSSHSQIVFHGHEHCNFQSEPDTTYYRRI